VWNLALQIYIIVTFLFHFEDSPPSWRGSTCYYFCLLQSQWKDLSSVCNRWNDSHVWYPCKCCNSIPSSSLLRDQLSVCFLCFDLDSHIITDAYVHLFATTICFLRHTLILFLFVHPAAQLVTTRIRTS
jgi:hypothetical protein